MGRKSQERGYSHSRRTFLAGAGLLVAGGALGHGTSLAAVPAPTAGTAPPLPWKWPGLDPYEAGSLAYHYYLDSGG
jgi:hypothetical protein